MGAYRKYMNISRGTENNLGQDSNIYYLIIYVKMYLQVKSITHCCYSEF